MKGIHAIGGQGTSRIEKEKKSDYHRVTLFGSMPLKIGGFAVAIREGEQGCHKLKKRKGEVLRLEVMTFKEEK